MQETETTRAEITLNIGKAIIEIDKMQKMVLLAGDENKELFTQLIEFRNKLKKLSDSLIDNTYISDTETYEMEEALFSLELLSTEVNKV